ncbi:hypothetical protein [Vibrio parahaemolyticus]|uniref:hypothetical protein n=1 Tax=Vibrio parahaemolyticus TaxID=670 RepID=UPI0003F72A1E|nr:hypothetical protein [Vibrio parahaemolyticus]EKG2461725.1 hypothetical protein [Vibrio vulnificus]
MNKDALKVLTQEEKSLSGEDKLQKALERLLNGKPLRTKVKGRLTLNKINNEAGLGRSYIHKFKEFVDKVANPAIEAYNKALDCPQPTDVDEPLTESMSEIDNLREELVRQVALKEDYRREKDELIAINDELEKLNKSLMFRVFELQQELANDVVEYEHHTQK